MLGLRFVAPLAALMLLAWAAPAPAGAGTQSDWTRAIAKRNFSQITYLLGRGIDVNLATKDGKTALMVAAREAERDLVKRLLAAGARVDAVNSGGGTPLMYATVGGDPEIVRLLLAHGARVDVQGKFGWTAMLIACAKGNEEIVRMLLEHGADVNLADIYGFTPLIKAAYENRLAVVRSLLEIEVVKLNAADDRGLTALHHAVAGGYIEITRALLARGADTERTDKEGRTAYAIAVAQGDPALLRLFRDRKAAH